MIGKRFELKDLLKISARGIAKKSAKIMFPRFQHWGRLKQVFYWVLNLFAQTVLSLWVTMPSHHSLTTCLEQRENP